MGRQPTPRPRSKGRLRSRTTQAGERGPASTRLASWRLVGEAGGSGKRAAWYQHRTRRDLPQQSWSDSPPGAVLPAAGLPNQQAPACHTVCGRRELVWHSSRSSFVIVSKCSASHENPSGLLPRLMRRCARVTRLRLAKGRCRMSNAPADGSRNRGRTCKDTIGNGPRDSDLRGWSSQTGYRPTEETGQGNRLAKRAGLTGHGRVLLHQA
ncbi:hypothetical protein CCHR01_02959 [Colletotrichum chrysophilum]|uniref:Uncharacterized protein n=1 Tax=Colletotrichum chrysophilum TaxID=1836956 RepID=A0AAD9AUT9_9PEZI|nr:hypothetical protein CCHR01_02959 [Colletotrichum chrysophilum]